MPFRGESADRRGGPILATEVTDRPATAPQHCTSVSNNAFNPRQTGSRGVDQPVTEECESAGKGWSRQLLREVGCHAGRGSGFVGGSDRENAEEVMSTAVPAAELRRFRRNLRRNLSSSNSRSPFPSAGLFHNSADRRGEGCGIAGRKQSMLPAAG